MPPREKPYDALCFVIDVGVTSSTSGFAESACQVASQLVQRRIYSEAPDHFAIVLVGSKSTDNPLGHQHVTIANYNEGLFSGADFNILKYLEQHIKAEMSDEHESDWMAGVQVAMDFFKIVLGRAKPIYLV